MNLNQKNKSDNARIVQLTNIARAAEITLIGAGLDHVILGRQIMRNDDIVIYVTWVTYSRLENLAALCKRHKRLYYIEPVLRENINLSCPTVNGRGPILKVHILPEYRM